MSLLYSPGVAVCAGLARMFANCYVQLSEAERVIVLRNFTDVIRHADRDIDPLSADEQGKKP